jgi:hypothetical protein
MLDASKRALSLNLGNRTIITSFTALEMVSGYWHHLLLRKQFEFCVMSFILEETHLGRFYG